MVSSEKVTGLVVEETGEAVYRLWEKNEEDGSWVSVVHVHRPDEFMPGRMIGTVYGLGEGKARRFKHSEQAEEEQGVRTAKQAIVLLVTSATGHEPVEKPKEEKKKGRRKKGAAQTAS